MGIGVPGSGRGRRILVLTQDHISPWAVQDLDKANQMLDAIGLGPKDADGYRLRTDNGDTG